MTIRAARPDEAARLSDLARRSKGHWGYSDDFLARCRAELSLSPRDVRCHPTFVVERHGALLGFYTLEAGDPNAAGFYEACGARRIGDVPSASIPGRLLPLFEVALGGGEA